MKINDFSGGINVRLDPSLLQTNEAVRYENINNSTGTLKSERNFRSLDTAIDRWLYLFEGEWYSSMNDREYLEYRNKLYWTERDNFPQKVVNGEVKSLGIAAPTTKLTAALNATGNITGDAFIPPSGATNDTAFSPSADHVAFVSSVAPYLTIYEFAAGRLTKLDDVPDLPVAACRAVHYSPNGQYLAVAMSAAPWVHVYRRDGSNYTKVANPATLPTGEAFDVAFSNNSEYLAVAHSITPFLSIYKVTSGVWTKLATPAAASSALGGGRGVAWTSDDMYLAAGHVLTPFLSVYSRATDTFTKIANPTVLPTSQCNKVAWTKDGQYLTAGCNNTPFIVTYNKPAAVLTKVADPALIPHAVATDVTYGNTDRYLVMSHATAPFLTVYSRSGAILSKMAGVPDEMPASAVNGIDFSLADLYLSTAQVASPYTGIYRRSDDEFKPYKKETTVQYVYTYYDSTEGIESAPSPISDELELPDGFSIDLSGFEESANLFVDKIRLYRLGVDTTEFTLLVELPIDTVTYNDNIKALDAEGSLLESQENEPPVLGLRFITEANGIMFAAKGDMVYYSKIGQPDYWPALNSFPISADVTGIVAIPDGVVFFTKSKAHILLGTSPDQFRLVLLNPEHGCISHATIQHCSNRWLFVSSDGICELRGSAIAVISSDKLNGMELNAISASVYKEQYFLTLADGSVMILDLRNGGLLFKGLRYPIQEIYNTGVFDNILYGVVDGNLARLHEGEELVMRYLSPEFTEGDASMVKLYNNIYIKYNGQLVVTLYIDGVRVGTEELNGKGIADVKIPQESQRGSTIQFEVQGVGTIYEIEYKVMPRDNGR